MEYFESEPFNELHVLIRAIARLKNIPVTLYIIGDHEGEPEYMRGILKEITRSGIETKVIFHGRMDHKTLSQWLKRSDLFVSPSRGEGYGRALAEAMFFGLPVIGADRGGS